MEEFLYNIFKELDVPAYYITRKSNSTPCVVYYVIESPKASSDDEEEITNFELFVVLYSGDDFVIQKRKVQELLKKHGFKKKIIPKPVYYEDLSYFEQPMQYTINVDTANI